MAIRTLEAMVRNNPRLRGCPCGATCDDSKGAPMFSVVLQVASIGRKRRIRTKAVTIHVCKKCAAVRRGKVTLQLCRALGAAVQVQAMGITSQMIDPNAA
jgi:hypothetical protein